ncbi:DUF1552 domain-containing protein [Aeoliella mucimassa]|uniref:DUF1552 domain-containing protein n=1 Tax=Aeoliella mucimassa TaxID=2527972 RepID=A0A518AKI4_9BACT|nr:DUF1552 domain-containing protein [Aeoliella mucimassa]QDU55239.1 hypothetical protein Pan181_14250 [Aeoliella mucimassa]
MAFQPIARRTFLRGLGTAIALPALEAMASSASIGAAAEAPKRLAFMYVPNGAHMPDWTPQDVGRNFALPKILEPLEKVRQHVSVLSGLAVDNARAKGDGPGDHARSAAAFLTGMHPVKTEGRDLRAGVSVDHIAAKYIAGDTPFPTLELGCEAGRLAGTCDSGYSCAYSNSISWQSATQPAGKEVNPQQVFDRLVGGGNSKDIAESQHRRRARQSSILDFVAEDARRLQRKVSTTDRQKLEEYLESIRGVERRIENPASRFSETDIHRPDGIPNEYANHLRVMGDLMVLAFQADLTRVSTLMFANEGSNRRYRELEITGGHHQLSHHDHDADKMAAISKINRYHVEQFAYIIDRMANIPEGDSTLLANTGIVYGSAIRDGNRHDHHDVPVLLAGNLGGTFDTGSHQTFPDKTPLMNLMLTMLQAVGAPVESVGDSTGTIALV